MTRLINLLKDRVFLRATATLIGTMVGVGVFGIPFAFAKAGFMVGFIFLIILAIFTLILNLIYGEVILRTKSSHQFVGYVSEYLNVFYKRISFFSVVFGSYAALLAYLIVAGEFLSNVLGFVFYVSPFVFSLCFFATASILILFGVKTVSQIELFMAFLFVLVVAMIFIFGAPNINFENFKTFNPEYWFFPYGVLVFALAGLSAIPIQRRILAGQEHNLRQSITLGVIFVTVLYLIFGITVLGVSGESTSPDAINGLIGFLGNKIIFLGSLFGSIAVSTSYLMIGSSLVEIFNFDYRVRRSLAWLLVVVPPLILFLGGLRNFIDVINIAGALALGLESSILIRLYIKSRGHNTRNPEYNLNISRWLLYLMAIIFILGAAYSLV